MTPESNFILKQRIACQMKALKKSFEMRVRVAGLSFLNVDEFLSAAPSMQPHGSVERARVRHLARHSECYLNLLTTVDILNESPKQALTIHVHTYNS